ncbi:MAG: copper-binding protein [Pseudomonadota bacterium]|nr:copper-binding protein [Pseudomonadota bacterium]
MHIHSISILAAGALALAACGSNDPQAQQQGTTEQASNAGSAAAQPVGEAHSARGDITEISGDRVTISHGPVQSIGWPAMTMRFEAPSPEMLQGLNVGDPVDFQFQKAGEQYALTSITKAQQ